jgi:hypothetical protein
MLGKIVPELKKKHKPHELKTKGCVGPQTQVHNTTIEEVKPG